MEVTNNKINQIFNFNRFSQIYVPCVDYLFYDFKLIGQKE